MITIIDYGAGNLQSIYNAFEALGEKTAIVREPSKLREAKAIVLPGVGAFGDGINNLEKLGFINALNEEIIDNKKPYLGICLGMQFLSEKSFEHGEHKGFGWINGVVKKIEPAEKQFKVPHMGWNDVKILKRNVLFTGLDENPVFYFVHSYFFDVKEENAISSTCWHGEMINASLEKDNIFAVQFHPEKSQTAGLKLLKNFIDYSNGLG